MAAPLYLPDTLIWFWFPWWVQSLVLPNSHAPGHLATLSGSGAGQALAPPPMPWGRPSAQPRPLMEEVQAGAGSLEAVKQ